MNVDAPFSFADALACAEASKAAYPPCVPDFATDLAHAVVRPSDCGAVLAFRGTADREDERTDVQAWKFPVGDAGCVHYGFWEAWLSVRKLVWEWPAWDKSSSVMVAGHSLGGAIAQLCAWDMARGGRAAGQVRVYTFGSPRVGDAAWRDDYDSLLGGATWHVVNMVDVVPRVPGYLAGFRRTGRTVLLTEGGRAAVCPSLPTRLAVDAVAVAYDLRHLRLGLVADHHVDDYVGRLRKAAGRRNNA